MEKHFHALEVAEVVPETAEANSIRFAVPPELADTFRFRAGQHLSSPSAMRRALSSVPSPSRNTHSAASSRW